MKYFAPIVIVGSRLTVIIQRLNGRDSAEHHVVIRKRFERNAYCYLIVHQIPLAYRLSEGVAFQKLL